MVSSELAISYHNHNKKPICSSYNCGMPCTYKIAKASGKVKWSPYCSRCKQASYGHIRKDGTIVDFADGVVPFRKGICSNKNKKNPNNKGRLGWVCPTNFDVMPKWVYGITDIDHKDGDSSNNEHKNLQELCKYCHLFKSLKNKDHAKKEKPDEKPYGVFQELHDQGLFILETDNHN